MRGFVNIMLCRPLYIWTHKGKWTPMRRMNEKDENCQTKIDGWAS